MQGVCPFMWNKIIYQCVIFTQSWSIFEQNARRTKICQVQFKAPKTHRIDWEASRGYFERSPHVFIVYLAWLHFQRRRSSSSASIHTAHAPLPDKLIQYPLIPNSRYGCTREHDYFHAWLLVCLTACYMPDDCLPVWLSSSWLHAYLPARMPDNLHAWLPACMPDCVHFFYSIIGHIQYLSYNFITIIVYYLIITKLELYIVHYFLHTGRYAGIQAEIQAGIPAGMHVYMQRYRQAYRQVYRQSAGSQQAVRLGIQRVWQ